MNHHKSLVALIPTILQEIPLTQRTILATVNWINAIRTAAQQTGEWTAEVETEVNAWEIRTRIDPQWIIENEEYVLVPHEN